MFLIIFVYFFLHDYAFGRSGFVFINGGMWSSILVML